MTRFQPRVSPVIQKITRAFTDLRVMGGYRVILADPPWKFEAWSKKGEAKSPQAHYDCMTLDEICAMPVELLAAPDCALFLWVTWPFMPEWVRVLSAWGFTFKGLGWEWIKYNKASEKYSFGGGYGTRKNLEPCLLATRGAPGLRKDLTFFGEDNPADGARSVRDFIEYAPLDAIRAPLREHSRKPDEQFPRVETLFDGPYIELFSRSGRPGWTSWGDQVGTFPEDGQ